MGSQWVEDPSWGNIFSGVVNDMQAAPGKALSNIAQAEAIKDARIKRAREQTLYDLSTKATGALDAAIPQAYVAPTDYTAVGPMVGDVNNPDDTAGIPTVDLQYTDPRAQAQAEARRNVMLNAGKAAIYKDPTNAPAQIGYGTVAAAGVPKTADERAQIQFMTTGKFPTAEETKINAAHNLSIIGADGQPTGRSLATQDFKREAITGRPITSLLKPGETVLATGPADQQPPNTYKDQAAARKALYDIENARIANGGLKTPVQAMEASRLFDVAYPRSRVQSDEGGRKVTKSVRAEPIPPALRQLYELADDVSSGRHLQPPPAPGAPPVTRADPNAEQLIERGPANPAELRKEYQNQQAVSDWAVTAPIYNSAVQSAQAPSNQQDINIVYAFAKLMDPGSVVRESEVKLASQSGTVLDTVGGLFQKLTTGGGSMSPEVRLAIIDTLKNRLDQTRAAKDIADKFYREQVAPDAGVKPEAFMVPSVEPLPYDRNQILRAGAAAAQPPPTTRSADDIVNGR